MDLVIHLPSITRVELLPERSELIMEQYDVVLSDGELHHLNLLITRDEVRLRLDNVTTASHLPQHIRTGRCPSHIISVM